MHAPTRSTQRLVWSTLLLPGLLWCGFVGACSTNPGPVFDKPPLDPAQAGVATVDRFIGTPGSMHVRSEDGSLPAPDEPIDFDQRFLVRGLGPEGEPIEYYDFDVRSQVPGKLYSFSQNGQALPDQLPVLAMLPGDAGYNDLVRVYDVAVPPGYRPNSVTSEADVLAAHFLITPSDRIINRPVVPWGSSALLRIRGGTSMLTPGWYAGRIAYAFTFEDRVPSQDLGYDQRAIDIADLYSTYQINPGQPGGGPASGVRTEPDSNQTHNVTETLPGNPRYSPLWMLITYDTAAFDQVHTEDTADAAPVVAGTNSPLLNAPIVDVEVTARAAGDAGPGAAGSLDAGSLDAGPSGAESPEQVR